MARTYLYVICTLILAVSCQSKNDNVYYINLTPTEFRERIEKAAIAYLPLGTLEWHGEHLPLGTDGIVSQAFFEKMAGDIGGIVLPMLYLGPDLADTIGGKFLYGMDRGNYDTARNHQYAAQQLDGSAYYIEHRGFGLILDAT